MKLEQLTKPEKKNAIMSKILTMISCRQIMILSLFYG